MKRITKMGEKNIIDLTQPGFKKSMLLTLLLYCEGLRLSMIVKRLIICIFLIYGTMRRSGEFFFFIKENVA